MPNKLQLGFIILGLCSGILSADILQLSKLKKNKANSNVHRDPFIFFTQVQPPPVPISDQNIDANEKKVDDTEELLLKSIIYEGYISIDGVKTAILNVTGETISARQGDLIREQLKIILIEEMQLKVEYNKKQFVIPKKGEMNG